MTDPLRAALEDAFALCSGCGSSDDRCASYGPGKKCCPDCEHRSATAPHPGEPHDFRTTCTRCGETGMLVLSLITPDEQVRTEPRP